MEARIRSPTMIQKKKSTEPLPEQNMKRKERGPVFGYFGVAIGDDSGFFRLCRNQGTKRASGDRLLVNFMAFFVSAIDTLKVLVTALGAGLGVSCKQCFSQLHKMVSYTNFRNA